MSNFRNPILSSTTTLLTLTITLSCLIYCLAAADTSNGPHNRHRQSTPPPSLTNSNGSPPTTRSPTASNHRSVSVDTLDADLPSPDSLPESGHGADSGEEGESLAEKPRITSAVRLSNTSLVLLWDLDADVEQLQSFVIQYKNKKGNRWITLDQNPIASSRAYQINGLKPGEYLFIVNAVYNHDNSRESAEFRFRLRANSKIKPEELPNQQAPVIDKREVTHDQIRFHWSYTYREIDFDYIGYLVYYRSTHSMKDFLIYNTGECDVELIDLESDTPYEMKVVAYNNVSVSQFSQPVIIRTAILNETSTSTEDDSSTSTTTTVASPVQYPHTTTSTTQASGRTTPEPKPTVVAGETTRAPELATTTPSSILVKPPGSGGVIDTSPTTTTIPNGIDFTPFVELLISPIGHTPLRYYHVAIVFLVILVFIALGVSFANCRSKLNKSPPSSTHESMTFDIEINGYFKNSFPAVDTDYHNPVATPNHHLDHQGFINNHPHINHFP